MHFAGRPATNTDISRSSISPSWPLRCLHPSPGLRVSDATWCQSSCSPAPLPAARSIWDRGDRIAKSRSRLRRNRRKISAHAASPTRRATPRAGRCSPSPARTKRRSRSSIARSRSILTTSQALYGRGLIYQGEKQHQQAIEDFTAANGLTPQKVEPLLARATSYLALDKTREAAARSRRGGAGRSEQRAGLVNPRPCL